MDCRSITIFNSSVLLISTNLKVLPRRDLYASPLSFQGKALTGDTVTVAVAVVSFFFMHDYPETAKFLTDDERVHVIAMLKEEDHSATHFDTKFIWQAFLDYKTWTQIGIYMG
jgi:hypothetical protein